MPPAEEENIMNCPQGRLVIACLHRIWLCGRCVVVVVVCLLRCLARWHLEPAAGRVVASTTPLLPFPSLLVPHSATPGTGALTLGRGSRAAHRGADRNLCVECQTSGWLAACTLPLFGHPPTGTSSQRALFLPLRAPRRRLLGFIFFFSSLTLFPSNFFFHIAVFSALRPLGGSRQAATATALPLLPRASSVFVGRREAGIMTEPENFDDELFADLYVLPLLDYALSVR